MRTLHEVLRELQLAQDLRRGRTGTASAALSVPIEPGEEGLLARREELYAVARGIVSKALSSSSHDHGHHHSGGTGTPTPRVGSSSGPHTAAEETGSAAAETEGDASVGLPKDETEVVMGYVPSCTTEESKACPLCAVTDDRWTPLLMAAASGDIVLCRILLGATEDPHSWTTAPVPQPHYVHIPMCDMLSANPDGNIIWHYAVRMTVPDVAVQVSSHASRIGISAEELAESLLGDLFERIVQAPNGSLAVSAVNSQRETALHIAVMKTNLLAVQFLLHHKADPSAVSLAGASVVQYATMLASDGLPDADAILKIISRVAELKSMTPTDAPFSLSASASPPQPSPSIGSLRGEEGGRRGIADTISKAWRMTLKRPGRSRADVVLERKDESSPSFSPRSSADSPRVSSDLPAQPAAVPSDARPVGEMTAEERIDFTRRQVIREIVETERDYVADLGFVVNVMMEGLRPSARKKDGYPLKKPVFDAIFSNITDIEKMHREFLSILELVDSASSVADAFLRFSPFFKLYKDYCAKSETQYQAIAQQKHKSKFVAHCERMRALPAAKRLDLEAFLIKPLQRVTRYPLLLRELLKNVAKDPAASSRLTRAMDFVNEIVSEVNSRKREVEIQLKLFDLNSRIQWQLASKDVRLVNSKDEPWDLRSADPPMIVNESARCVFKALDEVNRASYAAGTSRRRWASMAQIYSQLPHAEMPVLDSEGSASENLARASDSGTSLSFAAFGREVKLELEIHTTSTSEQFVAPEFVAPDSSTLKTKRKLYVFDDVVILCNRNRVEDAFSVSHAAVGSRWTWYPEKNVLRVIAPFMHCRRDLSTMANVDVLQHAGVDPGDICDCRAHLFTADPKDMASMVKQLRSNAVYLDEGAEARDDDSFGIFARSRIVDTKDSSGNSTAEPSADGGGWSAPLSKPTMKKGGSGFLAEYNARARANLTSRGDSANGSAPNGAPNDLSAPSGSEGGAAILAASDGANVSSSDVAIGSMSPASDDAESRSSSPSSSEALITSPTSPEVKSGASSLSAPVQAVVIERLRARAGAVREVMTLYDHEKEMADVPFYFGAISRTDAESLLYACKDSSTPELPHRFLLRLSSQGDSFVLSVWDGIKQCPFHVLITKTPAGWAMDTSSDPSVDPAAFAKPRVRQLIETHPAVLELRLTDDAGLVNPRHPLLSDYPASR